MLFLPAAATTTPAAAARAAAPAATPGAALATAPAAAALATTTAASARHDRLQWLIELVHLGRRVEVQDTLGRKHGGGRRRASRGKASA